MATFERSTTEVTQFLQALTVQDLVDALATPRPIVAVAESARVEDLLSLLREHAIQACPVYRGTPACPTYTGIVSVLNLLALLVSEVPGSKSPKLVTSEDQRQQWMSFLRRPVTDALALNRPDQVLPEFRSSDSVIRLLRTFALGGTYRALVHTPRDTILISQSDLVRYLWRHHVQFPTLMDLTMPQVLTKVNPQVAAVPSPSAVELPATTVPVPAPRRDLDAKIPSKQSVALQEPGRSSTLRTVALNTPVLHAFWLMYHAHVSALAVVDSLMRSPRSDDSAGSLSETLVTGPLSTELSASHLRLLFARDWALLDKPIIPFLLTTVGEVPTPFVIRRRFTLSQCVAGLLTTASRRAWFVADADDAPLAVFTMTDVLRTFNHALIVDG
ncbi:hypothetical protein H4R34_001455 [Dimargaris verticillata]|uniref:CBS domain-containing protein n=1 Tax=Dimargaris verticillata TaxID=2761393 RepID=A0A9W8B8G9_9FUNG|nr:hypothetical protein H4R34_001455 [Dimargaris verticillata]